MKRRDRSLVLAFIGLWILGLALIGSAHGDSALQQVSAVRGAVVRSPSGRLTLAIPPGALEKDTTVSVAETPSTGEGTVLGPTYDLGPTGLKFRQPVTLTIRFEPWDIPPAYDPEDVAITEVNPPAKGAPMPGGAPGTVTPASPPATVNPPAAGGAPASAVPASPFEYLDSEVDTGQGTVSTRIEHFSHYAARSYASWTLGSVAKDLVSYGVVVPPPGKPNFGLFDYGITIASGQGSGYATGNYHLRGEFRQTVGAKMGVTGLGAVDMHVVKWFRVKKGRKGESSTDSAHRSRHQAFGEAHRQPTLHHILYFLV
jgi:hypothetical protein